MTLADFDLIFGIESSGVTAEERAKTSRRLFVRSQDHLALYSEGAKGHVLTAWEVYQSYGIDVLNEVFEEGSAILANSVSEPSSSFKRRREQLGLDFNDVAKYSGVSEDAVRKIEDPKSRTSIHLLEKVAMVLGLDERLVGYLPGSGGDEHLSVRLRELGSQTATFNSKTVLAFHEAAWVIFTQDRLKRWLTSNVAKPQWQQFMPSANYGDASYPAWRHGYYLAHETRKRLGFSADAPINSLRDLFDSLDLPFVQMPISSSIAGATLASGESRGVIVNTVGANENVWVRRVTMAHELGHLLWDPDQNLKNIRVDKYAELEKDMAVLRDFVEQRANAFAVEFLAPQYIVSDIYQSFENKSEAVREIMVKFGISYTTTCHHIRNDLGLRVNKFACPILDDCKPTDEWVGTESFTNEYFPISTTRQSRRGAFSIIVAKAEDRGLISQNTAAEYLNCQNHEYLCAKGSILDLGA